MYTIGLILKEIREEMGYSLQKVQQNIDIDLTQLSRIENGKRLPTIEQIQRLAKLYNYDSTRLLIQRESDKVISSIKYPEIAIETLKVAEEKIAYGSKYLSLFQDIIYQKPIALESRRYIGSKAKLSDWIMGLIEEETEDVHTFTDIFAGTATISSRALTKYKKVIVNDFLY
ncbi:MAG: helix-turn-helix domain-containing protein, partial [Tannerellaceae bacterium]|nr:helix-turn-helix domain-containing protein [Tannerellaceae bacterium]